MKKSLFAPLNLNMIIMLLITLLSAQTDIAEWLDLEKAPRALRILTYNIRFGRCFNDLIGKFGLDLECVGNVISAIKPEYAGIQEVDRNNTPSEKKDQIRELERMTRLHSYYGIIIDFGGDEYGIGVFSIENAISVKSINLPTRGEPDKALIEIKFEDFVFFNTHLSLTAEFSVITADIINNETTQFHKPIILTRDFNISISKEFFNLFGNKLTVISPDEASWPADQPRDRFDHTLIADPTNQIPINGPHPERVRSEERINSDSCV